MLRRSDHIYTHHHTPVIFQQTVSPSLSLTQRSLRTRPVNGLCSLGGGPLHPSGHAGFASLELRAFGWYPQRSASHRHSGGDGPQVWRLIDGPYRVSSGGQRSHGGGDGAGSDGSCCGGGTTARQCGDRWTWAGKRQVMRHNERQNTYRDSVGKRRQNLNVWCVSQMECEKVYPKKTKAFASF